MVLLIGTFLGGLGLFLLGVGMITDGLRMAAGNSLREILSRSTRTSRRGLLSGFALTSLVQSSSAVTIATIGFVNAGLLGLMEALAVVMGASVGTTITGWLVAMVGFQFKLSSFALPMVGLGMLARLRGASSRTGALGEALAGFGLFFIGIDFLRTGFETSALTLDFADIAGAGFFAPLLFLFSGILLTIMTQSSSAAMAIILTALGGNVIPFGGAAAMIAGATIGTTSSSALAVIGATANARRVAAGHVIINSFNGLCALLLLPVLLWLESSEEWVQGLSAVMVLVFYHTAFNMLGVLLQLPLLSRMTAFLSRRFRSPTEDIARPEYLDRNILASPVLAMNAFLLELRRMAELTRRFVDTAFTQESGDVRDLKARHDSLRQLVLVIEQGVATLETSPLSNDIVSRLPLILRVANYLDEAVALAYEFHGEERAIRFLRQTPVYDSVLSFREAVFRHLAATDVEHVEFDQRALEESFQRLREQWRALKTELLSAGVNRQLPVTNLNTAIDTLRLLLRVAERMTRCACRLDELASAIGSGKPAEEAEPLAEISQGSSEAP